MTSQLRVQDLGLTAEDLERAAQSSLAAAATTDLGALPPGSGDRNRSWHHGRKRRFEAAVIALESGDEDPGEDQRLTLDDVAWAAAKCPRGSEARDRFAEAMELLADAKG